MFNRDDLEKWLKENPGVLEELVDQGTPSRGVLSFVTLDAQGQAELEGPTPFDDVDHFKSTVAPPTPFELKQNHYRVTWSADVQPPPDPEQLEEDLEEMRRLLQHRAGEMIFQLLEPIGLYHSPFISPETWTTVAQAANDRLWPPPADPDLVATLQECLRIVRDWSPTPLESREFPGETMRTLGLGGSTLHQDGEGEG